MLLFLIVVFWFPFKKYGLSLVKIAHFLIFHYGSYKYRKKWRINTRLPERIRKRKIQPPDIMENASARNLWGDYLDQHLEFAFARDPRVGHFFENAEEASDCLDRIMKGNQQMVSRSLLGLQLNNSTMPRVGDFRILTDGEEKARCVLRTKAITYKPFSQLTEDDVRHEGLGPLSTWKALKWEAFTKELKALDRRPLESMIVVCERFDKLFER